MKSVSEGKAGLCYAAGTGSVHADSVGSVICDKLCSVQCAVCIAVD